MTFNFTVFCLLMVQTFVLGMLFSEVLHFIIKKIIRKGEKG